MKLIIDVYKQSCAEYLQLCMYIYNFYMLGLYVLRIQIQIHVSLYFVNIIVNAITFRTCSSFIHVVHSIVQVSSHLQLPVIQTKPNGLTANGNGEFSNGNPHDPMEDMLDQVTRRETHSSSTLCTQLFQAMYRSCTNHSNLCTAMCNLVDKGSGPETSEKHSLFFIFLNNFSAVKYKGVICTQLGRK